MMRAGGWATIAAIALIFLYLLYVVFPLFMSASVTSQGNITLPQSSRASLTLMLNEYGDVATRVLEDGRVLHFSPKTGELLSQDQLRHNDAGIAAVQRQDPASTTFSYVAGNSIYIAALEYRVSYDTEQKRIVTPVLSYPLADTTLRVRKGSPITQTVVYVGEEKTTVAAADNNNRLYVWQLEQESSLDEDEPAAWTRLGNSVVEFTDHMRALFINPDQTGLLALTGKRALKSFSIDDGELEAQGQTQLFTVDDEVTAFTPLTGGLSYLAGNAQGEVAQIFSVRIDNNDVYKTIRTFKASDKPVRLISSEPRRRGFVTVDDSAVLAIHHSTAERTLLELDTKISNPLSVVMGPRADTILLEGENGSAGFYTIHNEHPEVSLSVLLKEVWYESYDEPGYTWQSSSASNDFEPKFSLTPLIFGTIKAAFYAMMIAVPLSIAGAIYTAYFMAPRMRRVVKPSIEIMEALPTVILGFIAGLWLAPFIEANLAGVMSLLLIMPPAVLLVAWLWHTYASKRLHNRLEGWQAATLMLPIILVTLIGFGLGDMTEALLFDGDTRQWMDNTLGISYDQRNSLVVGIAMGIAVIPTIFSITEDAVFSVPKHLTTGSLALGATRWQTLTRVILLTASPGIFSAIMIGLGRAVGETMIVLMATGNTPVMDLSLFQGMRTLSANVAVEMPESEVDSTHYRILFLAALVLFVMTFAFNTIAETVRQNLRRKYGSL
jgi:phosphate transport system permease protein